ncbi:hypothetical protein A5806_002499 [Enterococcus faecium]|nr:hypothetical protein A5806_002499 [Enterococcus faecium]
MSICIISLLIGILSNILMFVEQYRNFFSSLTPIFLIAVLGMIISIFSIINNKVVKFRFLSVCALLLNASPLLFYLFLILTLG